MSKAISPTSFQTLLSDVQELITQARNTVARRVNSALVLLYWHIGKRINQEVLHSDRAAYGKSIIKQLASYLTQQFGEGFDSSNLSRMVKLSRIYSEDIIAGTLSQQLSWSKLTLLIAIEDPLKRDFYAEMCRIENWNVRGLKKQISTSLFERTALSKKPVDVIKQQIKQLKAEDQLTPELIFRDPCILSFTGLSSTYSETDLENAILNNITEFMREMGTHFCFVARQKRMSTDDTDRYLDLLFFQRRMRQLIAIELKIEPFQPEHKGQMEWYLNWLDRHERLEGEGPPLGIILCADKKNTDVEYLSLENSGIHVAQYILDLPPKDIFEKRLQAAIAAARERYESQKIVRGNDSPKKRNNNNKKSENLE